MYPFPSTVSRPRHARRRRRFTSAGAVAAVVLAGAAGSTLVAGPASAAPPTAAMVSSNDQTSPGKVLRSHRISTSAPELLVAFLSSDTPASTGNTFSSMTGCGLSWSRVASANGRSGVAEVWRAQASAPLYRCSLAATRGFGSYLGSITVVGFTGAARVGAVATASSYGAAAATLTPVSGDSLVYAVGSDWDGATGRTLLSGQRMVHQDLASVGDTYWTQSLGGTTTAGTDITIGTAAPSNHRFNLAAIEIVPSDPSTTPPPAPSPSPTATATSPAPSPSPTATATSPAPSPSPTATATSPAPSPTATATSPAPSGGVTYGWQLTDNNTGLAGAGIDRNTLPVYSGSISSGQTLTKVKITHDIDLSNLTNVTLDRVWIAPSSCPGNALTVGAGTVIKDSDITGEQAAPTSSCEPGGIRSYGSNGVSVQRVLITGVSIGMWFDGDGAATITDTYVHNMKSVDGQHVDGFTRRSGIGQLTLLRDRLDANVSGSTTGAFFLQDTWGGRIAGVTLQDSMLEGIGYLMTLDNGGSGVSFGANNVRFRLSTPNYYGNISAYGGSPITYTSWSNNYNYDGSSLPSAMGSAVQHP